MEEPKTCNPEHHCWHLPPTGQGAVYCYHCGMVKPGTEPKPAAADPEDVPKQ